MKEKVIYLLKFYLATVLLFVVAKVVFMFYNRVGHNISFSDYWQVIQHGLSLDLSMSLYLLSAPFLLVVASLWLHLPRWIFRVYYVVAAILLSLAFVADTSLYEFWQFKLDASCLSYLETPTEAMASVSIGYILVRLLSIIACSFFIYWLYDKLTPLSLGVKLKANSHKLIGSVVALLLIPLIVIGIRGGIGESTTNIGQVYYSQNQFLNHSAVNPMFSFFASFERTATNIVYDFMDDAESQRVVGEYYNTQSIGVDTLLTTQHPNIIVILLESCGSVFTEVGGRKDVTPNLNRFMREGIYFSNCYGNTWRTDRGTLCTWSGYPSFPTMSVMKMPAKSRSLSNMAKSLQEERGYHTYYLYGGDINFTNMRSYLIAGGFSSLHWMKDYSKAEQQTARWGVRDDITFKTLFSMTSSATQPFLIGYSTLSSHEPWDVPIQHFEDEKLNAFYYLDQCVGDFIRDMKKSPIWKNTLIILLPDHGIPYGELTEADPLKNQIPMIWLGGAVKEPRKIAAVCNQTDLPATLLGQLGVNHDSFTFSRDVLSHTYTHPFAVNTFDDGISVYDSTGYVTFDFISNRVVASHGPNAQSLLQRGKAVLQAASKDLDKR